MVEMVRNAIRVEVMDGELMSVVKIGYCCCGETEVRN
jgi:hypothetical protein